MKRNLLIAALLIAAACVAGFTTSATMNRKRAADLSQQIVGEWRNVYLKIVIHHQNVTPIEFLADSSNWEKKLGLKPIRTHFKEDGSYYSEYYNLKDSLTRRPAGTWTIKGDTIIMAQKTPTKSNYHLHLKIVNDHASFNGLIDFDGEGEANDVYFGIQKRFAR